MTAPPKTHAPSPAPPSAAPIEKTATSRERILAEATRLFADRGYADVSMQAIANAAKMTKAALYYHFKDKQELFAHVVRTEALKTNTRIAAIVDDASSLDDLLYRTAVLVLESGRGEMRRLLADVETFIPAEARARYFADLKHPAALLEGRLETYRRVGIIRHDIDTEMTTELFLSMISGQVRRLNAAMLAGKPYTPRQNDHLARGIVNLVLRGITHDNGEDAP